MGGCAWREPKGFHPLTPELGLKLHAWGHQSPRAPRATQAAPVRPEAPRTRQTLPRVGPQRIPGCWGRGGCSGAAPGLTFRYWRLEKILPQPSKSHRRISCLAAFLWDTGQESSVREDAPVPPEVLPTPEPGFQHRAADGAPPAPTHRILLGLICATSSSLARARLLQLQWERRGLSEALVPPQD